MLITVKGTKYRVTRMYKRDDFYSEIVPPVYTLNPEAIESVTYLTGYNGKLEGEPTEGQIAEFKNYKHCRVLMSSGEVFMCETKSLQTWLAVTKQIVGVKPAS